MNDNTAVFSDFARRAKERIEQRKKKITKKLRVEAAGVDITIRALTDQEISECMEFSDDSLVVDKYLIYHAVRLHSPVKRGSRGRQKCL